MKPVAVVGGGLAGLRTCEALRTHGFDGPVTLVCAESHLPYDRPPLSKEILRGDVGPERASLRTPDELVALDVDVRLGRRAVALDVAERQVRLDNGDIVGGGDVVIATGARPRSLPGEAPAGVHVLRTLDDAVALRDVLAAGTRIVIIGAGFIGLEVAASAVTRGCAVTVVEPLPAPLARVLHPHIGAAITELHAAHGVVVRCGVGVTGIGGHPTVEHVKLSDGSSIPADVVVVGIGVAPDTDWLAESGLSTSNGVHCDETLQAAPHVWAVGDVCEWWSPSLAGHVRVEHWTNAGEQGDHVARAILGDRKPFDPVPYFWSDQYDAKLQVLGLPSGGDEVVVVRGAVEEPKWVALVRRGERLSAVVGLRSPAQVMRLRPLLGSASSWNEALAATATRVSDVRPALT